MKYIIQLLLIISLIMPINSYCDNIYDDPPHVTDPQAEVDSYINSNKRVIRKYDNNVPQQTVITPTPTKKIYPSTESRIIEEELAKHTIQPTQQPTENTQTIIDRILRSKVPSEFNEPNLIVDEYNAKVQKAIKDIVSKHDPYKIRLGTTDFNTRDYLRLGLNIKNEFSTTPYKVEVIPNSGSVKNLIALQEGKLDWAIINADALIALPTITVEIIAKLPPKYAHLIIRKSGNDHLQDLDDLDENDRIAIGDIGDDSYTTWNILKNNVSNYGKIPTMARSGHRAAAASQVGLTQGFFRVSELLDPIITNANDTEAFKMIHINNKKVYLFNNTLTSQMLYENVRMKSDVYNNLISDGFFPKADTMEIPVLLVTSKDWYNKYSHVIESVYPNIQQAIRNVNDANLKQ